MESNLVMPDFCDRIPFDPNAERRSNALWVAGGICVALLLATWALPAFAIVLWLVNGILTVSALLYAATLPSDAHHMVPWSRERAETAWKTYLEQRRKARVNARILCERLVIQPPAWVTQIGPWTFELADPYKQYTSQPYLGSVTYKTRIVARNVESGDTAFRDVSFLHGAPEPGDDHFFRQSAMKAVDKALHELATELLIGTGVAQEKRAYI